MADYDFGGGGYNFDFTNLGGGDNLVELATDALPSISMDTLGQSLSDAVGAVPSVEPVSPSGVSMDTLGQSLSDSLRTPDVGAITPGGVSTDNLTTAVSGSDAFKSAADLGTRTPGMWDTLGSIAKSALPFLQVGQGLAGVGTGIMGAVNAGGQNRILNRAQRGQMQAAAEQRQLAREQAGAAREVVQPAARFAASTLNAASEGKLTPPQQASVDQWKQEAKARIHSWLARIGQGDSQTLQQWDNYIDQQALAMENDMIAQNAQLGISATQAATGGFGPAGRQLAGWGETEARVAQSAGQSGEAYRRSVADANKAIDELVSMGG